MKIRRFEIGGTYEEFLEMAGLPSPEEQARRKAEALRKNEAYTKARAEEQARRKAEHEEAERRFNYYRSLADDYQPTTAESVDAAEEEYSALMEEGPLY